ncbi:hypothetical protein TRFO_13177 [Tritrichomonas foetus]|uniref:Importin N-terminal domain-containing protein n=1 Tax=Tritrichomonas foetus TaxID=1144522 RepID=A0A1J4KZJ0_9EUKA|nr:hypothetical protein TRFO_13177 [Tritrichomonas foetus]|eukprot:OHT16570.1 hypothetical protein TRFO_13177 [Tritrichomonas foetus]
MIEQIANLFLSTFSQQSSDEQIQGTVNQLNSYGGSPEFCQSAMQIILSDQLSQSVRKAATIYIYNMIESHWDQNLSPQSKEIIINAMPPILMKMNPISYPTLSKLTNIVVKHTFYSGEWPNMTSLLIQGLSSNEEAAFSTSLVLSKALSSLFQRQLDDDKMELYVNISNQLLASLTQFVTTSNSLFHVSICFKIGGYLSKNQIPPFFRMNQEAFVAWFGRVCQVAEPSEDQFFQQFALAAIKFASIFFYKFKDDPLMQHDIIIDTMNAIIGCSCMAPPTKVLGKCARFIKLCFANPLTWASISSDFVEFTKCIILPFFILTPDDMNDAVNDPQAFVINFHAHCYDDSDPRCTMTKALTMHGKVLPEFGNTFSQLLLSILPLRTPEYDQITYSVCYLFSTVSSKVDQSIGNQIAPLLQSNSFIVRCAALLALKDMDVPPEIVLATFSLLQDEYTIVKYYAALALSTFLQNMNGEKADLIRNQCGPHVQGIIQTYFQLAQEFCDYDFIDLIRIYIQFFGPILFDIAPSVITDIFQVFLNCSNLNAQATIVLSAISKFLDLLTAQQEILNQSCIYLLMGIYKLLDNNVLQPDAIKTVIELLANIVAVSPQITELHWQVFQVLTPLFSIALDEICTVFKNLIIKDTETARKPDISNNLFHVALILIQQQPDPVETGPIMSFLASLLVILTGVSTSPELYQNITPLTVNGLNIPRISSNSFTLFGAMLIFDAQGLFNLLGDSRSQTINTWANTVRYTTQTIMLTVINKCNAIFTQDELSYILVKAIMVLHNSSIENSLFSADPEEQSIQEFCIDVKRLSLLSTEQILVEFSNVLNTINSNCPSLIQQVQSQFQKPIMQIITEAAQVAIDL